MNTELRATDIKNQTQMLQTNQMDSNKVIQIFESQYTEQLHDRKANAIVRFCRERNQGFYYYELTNLIKMVQYAINDLQMGVIEMNDALQSILQTASIPFQKTKTSDELEFVPLLKDFLNEIKILLLIDNMQTSFDKKILKFMTEQLRYDVISFLKAFCSEGIDDILKQEETLKQVQQKLAYEDSPLQKLMSEGSRFQKQNFFTYERNLRSLNNSDIIEDIIFNMQYFSKSYQFLLPLLELISYCVLYKDLALKFSNFGVLKDIIYVIFECDDFRSYIVKQSFEIIWNSIEAVGISAIKLFAVEDIIFYIKKLFENIMKNGYKLEDKCLRNELLILINYLMNDENALIFFIEKQNIPNETSSSTFLDILLFYATIDEMTFYNEPIRTNNLRSFFGTNSEDLEFKKLIWSGILIAIQQNNEQILEAVRNSPFVMGLLLYIDPLANSYAINRWSEPQLREIQLHCLQILSTIILYIKDDFYEKNGLFCLTKFLTNNNDNERREQCLRAFNNASLFDESYKLKITEEGILDNLIDLLQHDNDNPIEIKELSFSIISNLCKECNPNKKLFRKKGGIDLIIGCIKDPNVSTSTRYILYTVSILDCLWNTILGSRKNESLFLDNEGMFVLLDFIEECDPIHKKMALSSLSYLIENPKALSYFCDWSSNKTMINATQLLISIYESEDTKYGVKYHDGIINNFECPLNPDLKKKKQEELAESSKIQQIIDFDNKILTRMSSSKIGDKLKGFQRLKDALSAGENGSNSGTEAYLINKIKDKVSNYDLRGIVFCILYRTGFDRNKLFEHQKQKIEVIQMYPQFKIGEIWNDIKMNLYKQGITPTEDDWHWMQTSIEEFNELVLNVINTQTLIAKEYKNAQEEDLQKFYDIIKSNKLTK